MCLIYFSPKQGPKACDSFESIVDHRMSRVTVKTLENKFGGIKEGLQKILDSIFVQNDGKFCLSFPNFNSDLNFPISFIYMQGNLTREFSVCYWHLNEVLE